MRRKLPRDEPGHLRQGNEGMKTVKTDGFVKSPNYCVVAVFQPLNILGIVFGSKVGFGIAFFADI